VPELLLDTRTSERKRPASSFWRRNRSTARAFRSAASKLPRSSYPANNFLTVFIVFSSYNRLNPAQRVRETRQTPVLDEQTPVSKR
jgi:hypothetical protein